MMVEELFLDFARVKTEFIHDFRSISGLAFLNTVWILRHLYFEKLFEGYIDKTDIDYIEHNLNVLSAFLHGGIDIHELDRFKLLKELNDDLRILRKNCGEPPNELSFFDNLIKYLDDLNQKIDERSIDRSTLISLRNKNDRCMYVLTELEILEADLD